ncbi:T4 family baseplate hub assembly chaperone [Streptomyces mayteni]
MTGEGSGLGAAALGAAGLLAVWEAGLATGGVGRALLLHSAARPAAGTDELLATPVGRRDADLFALRAALFGDRMDVRVTCEECEQEMEFGFSAAQAVAARPRAGGPLAEESSAVDSLVVEEGGWTVRFRLPTTGDLAAAEEAGGPEPARRLLLRRCVLTAELNGTPKAAERLPEPVQRRITEAAAEADPRADIRLAVACPECGHRASAELDIAAHLWAELDAWAQTTLLDVHLLASAYGWSEAEILALSPLRRRYYLELCADV